MDLSVFSRRSKTSRASAFCGSCRMQFCDWLPQAHREFDAPKPENRLASQAPRDGCPKARCSLRRNVVAIRGQQIENLRYAAGGYGGLKSQIKNGNPQKTCSHTPMSGESSAYGRMTYFLFQYQCQEPTRVPRQQGVIKGTRRALTYYITSNTTSLTC